MPAPNASLTAAVDERKARLAKLRSLKRKQPEGEIAPPESNRSPSPPAPSTSATTSAAAAPDDAPPTTEVSRLHLSGRNYDPETRGPKLGFEAPPVTDKPTLEELAAEVETEVREKAAEEERDDKGIDLFRLQPKKPNWDLKRDLEKKLEVLNVRTDNAIARMVRERIAGAQSAAAGKDTRKGSAVGEDGDGAVAGMDGAALVEGLRVREREEAEEERREREELEE